MSLKSPVAGLVALFLLRPGPLLFSREEARVAGKQLPHTFSKVVKKELQGRYLLFLPQDFRSDGDRKWPLILFLHGAGERGDDLDLVTKHGPPKIVKERQDFPFIVLSPQCPRDELWSSELLLAILDEVIESHAVDEDRIYLTGLSMGGYSTWSLGARAPERFAALAPICGGGSWVDTWRLGDMPVWAFHGAYPFTRRCGHRCRTGKPPT